MEKIVFFDVNPDALLRIVVVGTLTYISIILLLRISGKRTLASMNTFDFIITVAMGSAFGRVLTAKTVSFFEALTTFILLITLQFIISRLSMYSKNFRNFITSQPKLLYYNGQFLEKNIKKERLKKEEILFTVRFNNVSSMDEVEAVIFETTGSISVIKKSEKDNKSAYQNLIDKDLK